MNRRRFLIAGSVLPAIASMRAALGQTKRPPVLIGWLNTGSQKINGHFLAAFKDGMEELGRREGTHFVLEAHWGEGRLERLPALAKQLAVKKPAVIVAATNHAVAAAAKAAPTTPIVQATGGDPVIAGFAASLARPGGMITGLTNLGSDLNVKFIELLVSIAPKIRRVGFLVDSTVYMRKQVLESGRRSAAQHSIDARFEEADKPEEIEPALARLAKQGVQGLIVTTGPMFVPERQRILDFATARRWPVVAGGSGWADAGCLLSYGIDGAANYRRAASYVDRILKGAKPGDLPIEQPTKIELVINRKVAKAFGLTIPQELILRADRVIE